MPARRTHHFSRAAAGALAAVAIAAPAAGARPAVESPGHSRLAEPPAPIVTRVIDGGFEWSSAAIGAGGAAAVLLLTAAGATTVTRRRHHHIGAIH
jgi:hypothetical protein